MSDKADSMNSSRQGDDAPESFEASKLGRKDHWDSVYGREINTFKETGDIGEVWFGEDTAAKMATWVCNNIEDNEARILDVGCGNGHLLLELAEDGYTNLTGTDYSPQAIELAKSIAVSRGCDTITFVEQDFLSATDVARIAGDDKFDVVLDKGTYDAICLKPKDDGADVDQKAIDTYPKSVVDSLKDSGVFLITSCNWTEDELVARFAGHLECVGRVKHRSFMFGGTVGQTVATVAFKKCNQLSI